MVCHCYFQLTLQPSSHFRSPALYTHTLTVLMHFTYIPFFSNTDADRPYRTDMAIFVHKGLYAIKTHQTNEHPSDTHPISSSLNFNAMLKRPCYTWFLMCFFWCVTKRVRAIWHLIHEYYVNIRLYGKHRANSARPWANHRPCWCRCHSIFHLYTKQNILRNDPFLPS